MSDMSALVARLEKVATRLESVAASGGVGGGACSSGGAAAGGASVEGYDEIVNGALANFIKCCGAIGDDVAEMGAKMQAAFAAQRAFVAMASESKKPAAASMPALLQATSSQIQAITEFKDKSRSSKNFNHLSAVAEGIPALGWVTMEPKPAPFIKEMSGAAQFYSNRVIKEFKGKDDKHVEWAKALVAVFTDLQAYVKNVHTTGLVWNPNGSEAKAAAGAPAAAAAPAPAAKPKSTFKPALGGGGAAKGGLFAELSKGGDVTKGLKKVDRSQMTHKNPELRASSVVKASDTTAAAPVKKAAPKYGGAAAKKEPVFELQGGKKWVVEYQNGNQNIVIEETELRQTVYIYKCENSTIQIKGKVNSISLDSCKKVGVAFDNAVSVFDVVNCKSIQCQVLGRVPTVSIDKTDGAQIYLSKDCITAEVVTAKSSEVNVLVPKDDGDFGEMAVPEQFKTVYNEKTGKLETTASDIAS